LRPIPNRTPSGPDAREPISVAIPFNELRKRRELMQDVNVGNVKEDAEKERVTLRSSFKSTGLYMNRVGGGAMLVGRQK
jgi:hypothetical protein